MMKKILMFLVCFLLVSLAYTDDLNRNTHEQNRNKQEVTNSAPLKPMLSRNKNVPDHLVVSKNVATDLFRGTFDTTFKANRIAIANDILNQVSLFNNLIPNPTPDEINWINAEDKATKHELLSTRRINLADSPEFQKYKLKNYLSAIITSLRMIIISDNLKDEMYWWGNLSSLLIDEQTLNDALYTLKINGKFPSEIERSRNICIGTGERGADYNMCYHSFGEGILSYILIPYLQMKA